ncbi:MAG TPA: transglycosylase SLT domain-containing protein [Rhodanobacteraceae bacterium]
MLRLPGFRRIVHPALLACGLAACLGAQAATAPTTTRQAQRDAFRKAYAAAQQGGTAWQALATHLKSYPLYPWLPAAALEHDIATVSTARVERYLKRYPDLLPAHDLRRHFLAELARRKDWSDFRHLYHPGLGTALACDALQGKLAQGKPLAWKDLSTIWQHAALPAACTPVQQWAQVHGLLTRQRLWQRIDLAVDAGNPHTIATLSRWLVGDDKIQAQHLTMALRDPATAADQAQHWVDNTRNQQAATLAMVRLARQDSDQADHRWPALRSHFHFSSAQTDRIRRAMAVFTATDFTPDALSLLIHLPASAQNAVTREWRVRVALAAQNWPAALAAINALDPEQKKSAEWRYWHARVLGELGYPKAAKRAYTRLAHQATYYGFLSADRAGLPYAICPITFDGDSQQEQALLHRPAMERAFELFYVGLLHEARRVWVRALDGSSARMHQLAAQLAWQRGWYDRAIRTFSYGHLKHLYRERFPLARQDHVSAQARAAGIAPSWAYAIIRAESAWAPDALSHANARGLMQLVPDTARLIAGRHGMDFDGDLYDPQTNIALGTRYLAHLAAKFDNAPYLASAAYNAGPDHVAAWLAQRGKLAPDLFVATIPYHETRDYVMRVMAYSVIYDWRLHGSAVALSRRMPVWGKTYTPPDAGTPRKSVACTADHG